MQWRAGQTPNAPFYSPSYSKCAGLFAYDQSRCSFNGVWKGCESNGSFVMNSLASSDLLKCKTLASNVIIQFNLKMFMLASLWTIWRLNIWSEVKTCWVKGADLLLKPLRNTSTLHSMNCAARDLEPLTFPLFLFTFIVLMFSSHLQRYVLLYKPCGHMPKSIMRVRVNKHLDVLISNINNLLIKTNKHMIDSSATRDVIYLDSLCRCTTLIGGKLQRPQAHCHIRTSGTWRFSSSLFRAGICGQQLWRAAKTPQSSGARREQVVSPLSGVGSSWRSQWWSPFLRPQWHSGFIGRCSSNRRST